MLNLYFDKYYPNLLIPPWAAQRAKRAIAKISEDRKVAAKSLQGLFSITLQHVAASMLTLPDLELYLLEPSSRQIAKPSQVPPSSPSAAPSAALSAATNQTTLGTRGSENIEGGHNGFDTILQDEEREARQLQTPAFPQSLPPLNGFIFPSPTSNPSLHHTRSQRSNNETQAMSNLQPRRHEITIELSQYQEGRGWPPSQQFSMDHVQEPNQPLNPNQAHRTAHAATTGSEFNSNADPFRIFTQKDKDRATKPTLEGKGNATRPRKRQKLDNMSNPGQVSSASTWQSTTVGGQGQVQDQVQVQRQAQAQALVNMQAPLYSGTPLQQGMLII